MICVRVVHLRDGIKDSKKIIVSVAILQIHAHMLHISTCEVDCASFSRDGARIQWHIVVHLHWLLFECARLKTIELDALLVPLEGMEALRVLWSKAALDIVVNSEIALNHISEVTNNFICILVEQSLQFRHFLVVVEVLFVFGVQLNENGLIVLQRLDELLSTALLSQIRGLLKLLVLLLEPVIELWQLDLHIVLNILLLISNDLENFIFEFLFTLDLQLIEFVEH